MRLSFTWVLVLASCCWTGRASAQVQLLKEEAPSVFGAGTRSLQITWRNAGDSRVAVPVRLRLYQASAGTAMPVGEIQNWKSLQMLPHQTVLETASVAFPPVNAETRFVIQWLDETNKVLGRTDVVAYPTNLLSQLRPLGGDKAIGVFDPQNQLKPLLKNLAVEFEDLETDGLEGFSGRLVIIGPLASAPSDLFPDHVADLAKKGAVVVWISPAPKSSNQLKPSFYLVRKGKGTVLVAEPNLVDHLAETPRSQLHLVQLCRRALRPEPFEMPAAFNQTEP